MASVQAIAGPDTDVHHHKRTKSSVLKSFINIRTLSKGTEVSSPVSNHAATDATIESRVTIPLLPADHPYARALGELQQNQQSQALDFTRKSTEDGYLHKYEGDARSLHKRTKSAITLKSLTGKDTDKQKKVKDECPGKPKKTKSSTNLATLLSRPRSNKNLKSGDIRGELLVIKDKENMTPPGSSPSELPSEPPIYAQFSSQRFTTQPLGGKFLENEIDLYTPQEYSPSKQRNFYGGPDSQPTLGRSDGKKRPKSAFLPTSYSVQDMQRQISGTTHHGVEQPRKTSLESRNSFERQTPRQGLKPDSKTAKREARAINTVTAPGTKTKRAHVGSTTVPNIEDVDAEFEAMLDRRNIPEHQRHKMRSLALSLKKDFIRQDWAETAAAQSGRSGTTGSDENADDVLNRVENREAKARRPRSLTFTLSKSSKEQGSPTKKPRSENTLGGHVRTRSSDSTSSYGKTLSSTGAAVANTLIAKAKGQLPDDFVAYLRRVPRPESVEVGKLHKLRLLLRNETVAWTDEFIGLGGMMEIVALLHRTMEVEWR